MSQTKDLSDLLKSAQTAPSLSDISMLLVNISGTLCKTKSTKIPLLADTVDRSLDADTLTEPGAYLIPSQCINIPSGLSRGVMLVLKFDPNVYQILVARKNLSPAMYVRMHTDSGTEWSPWFQFSLTQL